MDDRERIEAEADDAVRMPGWVWVIGPVVFVSVVALSAVWPWGWGIAP